MARVARLLAIGGSDSGGGAGIQADIKTAMALGAYACTAVTAITAQNTQRVAAVEALAPSIIASQIDAVVGDLGCDAAKTGMLGTANVVLAVAQSLARLIPRIPLVVDPVMISTTGSRLLDADAVTVLCNKLLPRASVVTPNIPEAEILSALPIHDRADMLTAARAILALGPQAVLVKGGHLPGPVVHDVLVTAGSESEFVSPRIESKHTHGTGCTLAAALAVGLAQGLALPTAVDRARRYVISAISTAPGLGQGQGPLNHAIHCDSEAAGLELEGKCV
jgi:hydroxymethylpyrimidine/phosphomethylpyrimidine kinase